MGGGPGWLVEPWQLVLLGWAMWLYAVARRQHRLRRMRLEWEPWQSLRQQLRRPGPLDRRLFLSGWLLLLGSLSVAHATRWLALTPVLGVVGWLAGRLGLALLRERRAADKSRRRVAYALDRAEAHRAQLAAAATATAQDWLALARQTIETRSPEAPRRTWRCLDRAGAAADPDTLVVVRRLEAGLVSVPHGPEPLLLSELEARARESLGLLDSPALPAGARVVLTGLLYTDLRELEPSLDPLSARWLWWRATGGGLDREQWLRATERLAAREPAGVAPEACLVEPLQTLLRPRAGLALVQPCLSGAIWPLHDLASGTCCRAASIGRTVDDGTLLTLLEAGALGQAVDWLAAHGPRRGPTVVRWAMQQASPEALAELTREVMARAVPHAAALLAGLAVAAGRYRRDAARPTLDAIGAGRRLVDGGHQAPLRLALAVAWQQLDPGCSVAMLRPLLLPGGAGPYRHAAIEAVARLRHPAVDDLLRAQAAAGPGPGEQPWWWLGALAALGRRGDTAAQAELDALELIPRGDPRLDARSLGRLAAVGGQRGLELAMDYVLGRHGAGPPKVWAHDVRESCRLRMLESYVAGSLYRRYVELAMAAVRGPLPEVPNWWAEEFRDALPLTA